MENELTPERIAQIEIAFICRLFDTNRDLIVEALKELGPFHRKAIISSIKRVVNAVQQSGSDAPQEGSGPGEKGQPTE